MGKVCTKCNIEKPTAEFSKMKSSKDGFQYVCKECNLKYIAENLASRKEYLTKYYLANKNIVTIKGKQYRDLHRQEIKERDKKYRDTNKNIILKIKTYTLKKGQSIISNIKTKLHNIMLNTGKTIKRN
jgi:recombinational DNA repair protein RecR